MEKDPTGTKRDSEQQSSSGSSITMPMHHDSAEKNTKNDTIPPFESSPPPASTVLWTIWIAITSSWRSFKKHVYRSTVIFVAGFVADVMSQPRLNEVMVDLIVTAMNGFMDQEDIGDKFDETARRVVYDPDKARDASHAIGQEVIPMVTGFMGGVAHSLKPSAMRRRKERREEKQRKSSEKSLQDGQNSNSTLRYSSARSGALTEDEDENDSFSCFPHSKKSE